MVERIRRHVVAHLVAAVVGEPQLARPRIPVESDGVAEPAREHLEPAAVGIHPHDVAVAIRIELADIARHAHRDVQLSVGAERDELAPVMPFGREAIADDDGGRRVGEALLDVVEANDARHRGHVERAILERHARGLAQSRRDHMADRLTLRAARRQRKRGDGAGVRASHEERAGGAPRHRPRIRDARDDFDREPGRQLERLQRQRVLRARRRARESPRAPR